MIPWFPVVKQTLDCKFKGKKDALGFDFVSATARNFN